VTGSENAPGAAKAPSRDPREILSHIRHAVAAIGLLRVPFDEYASDPGSDAFEIMGTGFVVGRGKIMTCHHVIEDLNSYLRKRRLPPERAALLFVRGDAAGESGWTVKVIAAKITCQ
jgi:hypothetical protein